MIRIVSWLLGALAYVAPLMWLGRESLALVRDAEADGGVACGLPALAMVPIAALIAIVFSGSALFLGWLALRAIATPRPTSRTIELVIFAIPMVAWVAFASLLLWGG